MKPILLWKTQGNMEKNQLDLLAPLIVDQTPANSTTDTGAHPISHRQPNFIVVSTPEEA